MDRLITWEEAIQRLMQVKGRTRAEAECELREAMAKKELDPVIVTPPAKMLQ